jgi:hypothetical protein
MCSCNHCSTFNWIKTHTDANTAETWEYDYFLPFPPLRAYSKLWILLKYIIPYKISHWGEGVAK